MACSMFVIKADFPQMLASEDVHITTSDCAVRGPDNSFKVKIAEKDTSVCFLLEGSRLASSELSRSCYVARAIEVLTTGVEQIYLVVVQPDSSVLLWLVVDHGAICTD